MTITLIILALIVGATIGLIAASLTAAGKNDDLRLRLSQCQRDLWQASSEVVDLQCDIAVLRREMEDAP
jgi:uncharacterized membrane-anchored protein YhcB (DUF1043 family)